MSVFLSQYTRALTLIPSDDANIPYPNPIITGLTTGGSANSLIDSEADFISLGVKTGDIVYNTSDNLAATVLEVVSATELLLNANATPASGSIYTIYVASSQSTNGNQGCYLYSMGLSDVEVITIGGDRVTFNNVQPGQILPVQVLKYIYTSDYEFVALW